jgi:hypothetical protein
MAVTIEQLKDAFKIGYDAFEESRTEAEDIWDLYHNRHYTTDQLAILANRGQPAETFNVIKLFARMLLGYYSGTVNTVVASAKLEKDIATASLLNDTINYVLDNNSFDSEGDKLKLAGMVSGLMCVHVDVVPSGKKDSFGRPEHTIKLEPVPDNEIIMDPMSRKDDYSDARYIHRFRWLSEEQCIRLFGKSKVEELQAYHNHIEVPNAEYEYTYNALAVGRFKQYDNYLIVHTCIEEANGKRWSIMWSENTILSKKEITSKLVKFPYRVFKVHTSDRAEYYGIFREVAESQKAINQAIIKIQLMVNSQKAFVQQDAVENMSAFTNAFNRVTAVIPVLNINGVRVENMSAEVVDQYRIIDRALDRIQRLLSINDSFLGMAAASDSGRKVKLQQNATITALRYLTGRIEAFYRLIGWDIANLAKQYFTANQIMRVSDPMMGQRWIEINKPMQVWTGKFDQQGQPIYETPMEEVLNPDDGKPMIDEAGNYVIAPIPEPETEFAFTDVDIEIVSTAYNDEDEKNQLMLETLLNGPIGHLLASVNPAGYFQAAAMSAKIVKTKYAPDVAAILEQTAKMLGGNQQMQQQAMSVASGGYGAAVQQNGANGGPMSSQLKLPQNTNEDSV